MKIALGVTGGIAAYKAAEIIRLLQDRGIRVQVVMTQAAQREFMAAGLPSGAFFADAFVTRAEVASAGP